MRWRSTEQKIQMLTHCNRIELVPLRPMKELKGAVSGIDTDVDRMMTA